MRVRIIGTLGFHVASGTNVTTDSMFIPDCAAEILSVGSGGTLSFLKMENSSDGPVWVTVV
ncbi:hypothetical protein [Tateyamaria sp. ANG-S1]|uniref:hypothetical protein n=1 Tax=Tateyamaria sp. ANG-S1 TaxID=1577905 RepID=UPI00057D91A8|nr:hypothetical protein [Tateyamaria sp. ANG-S1]KIC48383.1 hypothetical protein RA29_11435 [Tateyamaria sp. ANG-S1]